MVRSGHRDIVSSHTVHINHNGEIKTAGGAYVKRVVTDLSQDDSEASASLSNPFALDYGDLPRPSETTDTVTDTNPDVPFQEPFYSSETKSAPQREKPSTRDDSTDGLSTAPTDDGPLHTDS